MLVGSFSIGRGILGRRRNNYCKVLVELVEGVFGILLGGGTSWTTRLKRS